MQSASEPPQDQVSSSASSNSLSTPQAARRADLDLVLDPRIKTLIRQIKSDGIYPGSLKVKANPNLTGRQRRVEADLTLRLENRLEADKAYDSLGMTRGGKILSADAARELSPAYRNFDDRLDFTDATYGPASAYIIRRLYQTLDQSTEPDDRTLLVLAGGAASGKSTAIRSNGITKAVNLVYDSNLAGLEAARCLLDYALETRWIVKVMFIHTPYSLSVERMLLRAMDNGRYIPLGLTGLARLHAGARITYQTLLREYEGNEAVQFNIMSGQALNQFMNVDDLVGNPDAGWHSDIGELHELEADIVQGQQN